MQNLANEISKATATSVREYLSERKSEILAFIRALVEIESPSGDETASRAVVDLLASAARDIACIDSIERIPCPGYGEHSLIRAFGDARDKSGTILLVGHTDTVHERGSLAQRPWRIEANRVYAPGIFDMKANCAMALEVLRTCSILKVIPHREVVLLLTCDEETGSDTGRAIVEAEARRAACALVLEPPGAGGRVKTGRKGTGIFRLEVEGRASHAGLEPEKGVSAILELARQVERLQSLNDLYKGINVNVGVIEGGTRSNVVAAHASAEIDLRFSTVDEGRRVEELILQLRPFDERTNVIVSGGINRPPLERTDKVLSLYQRAKHIAALLDLQLGEVQVGGASDGNFIAALGVPVLDGLGIDGDGAHATHEHIILDDVARRGALLGGLIASL